MMPCTCDFCFFRVCQSLVLSTLLKGFIMLKKDTKKRAWGFILYPSSPDDLTLLDLIQDTHMACLVSPLHDRDTWTAADETKNPDHKAGGLKKPHYHGMWLFEGGARMSQALDLCGIFGDACPPYVEPVASVVGMTRYFAHLDDPDKYQYDVADIKAFGGAHVCLQRPLTGDDVASVLEDCVAWIRRNHVSEYADLVDHAYECEPDWVPVVTRRTLFFVRYLASLRGIEAVRHA